MSEEWRVVTAKQLRASGQSRHEIRVSVAAGRLRPVGRGVYLAGPRHPGPDGWLQEVAIAAARHPTGCLWGQTAAAIRQLDGFDPPVPVIVRVPPSSSARSPCLVRRHLSHPPVEVGGLTVASIVDTLVQLGDRLDPRPGCAAASTVLDPTDLVELALEDALRRELVTAEQLTDALQRAASRTPGRAQLATVLRRRPPGEPTGSYLETRCHQVLRDAGVPTFARQVEVSDRDGPIGRVDFLRGPVVIEVVGRRWHLDRFDADHRRYARLAALGLHVLTFTFDDIELRPGHVVSTAGDALGRVA